MVPIKYVTDPIALFCFDCLLVCFLFFFFSFFQIRNQIYPQSLIIGSTSARRKGK